VKFSMKPQASKLLLAVLVFQSCGTQSAQGPAKVASPIPETPQKTEVELNKEAIESALPILRINFADKEKNIKKTCGGTLLKGSNEKYIVATAGHCKNGIYSQTNLSGLNVSFTFLDKKMKEIENSDKVLTFIDILPESKYSDGNVADFAQFNVETGSYKLTTSAFSTMQNLPSGSLEQKLYVFSTIPKNTGLWKAEGFFQRGEGWGYYAKNELGLSGSPILECALNDLRTCKIEVLYAMHTESIGEKMLGIPGFKILAWLGGK
jgi:hypothetical protein